ncbi:MAG: hypothetical protein Q9195_003059 [Heterodermia aff. obscurata]
MSSETLTSDGSESEWTIGQNISSKTWVDSGHVEEFSHKLQLRWSALLIWLAMTTNRSVDGESPALSSTLLSQLRRSRRGSIASVSSTSQIGKDDRAETLDQIHSAASQSDTLTTFNEYTSPPSSSAGIEGKGITSELQGGLSGLYSRLRASVGNVKEIVTTYGDDNVEEDASTKSPRLAAPSPTPTRQRHDGTKSSNNSVFSGKDEPNVTGLRQLSQERTTTDSFSQDRVVKQRPANLVADAVGLTSRGSSTSNIGLRSPVALPVVAAAATPAVVEVNVNAVKDRNLIEEPVEKEKATTRNPLKASTESHKVESKLSSSTVQQKAGQPETRKGYHAEANLSPLAGSKVIVSGSGSFPTVEGPDTDKINSNGPSVRFGQEPASDISQKTSRQNTLKGSEINVAVDLPENPDKALPRDFEAHRTKDASTDETSVFGNTERKRAYDNLALGNANSRKYQHVEIPLLKPTAAQIKSRPRAPDVSLTRASSDATATTLISTSQSRAPDQGQSYENNQDYVRQTQARDVRLVNAVKPQARSKVLNREYWMRDENAKDCFYCGDHFSTFRRKHHCRTCGQIFDAKCTTLLSGSSFGQSGSLRVCKPCEGIIKGYDDSSDLSDDSSIRTAGLRPRHGSTGASDTLGSPVPRSSPFVNEEIRRSTAQPDLGAPTMAIPATRKAGGDPNRRPTILDIGPERTLARPSSSRSLKSSLSGRPHVSGHRRHNSRHLVQPRFKSVNEESAPFHQSLTSDKGVNQRLPAFHDDNIIDPELAPYLSDEESSGEEQMSIMTALGGTGMSRSLEHDKAGLAGLLSSSKKGKSRMGDRINGGLTLATRDADNISLSSSRGANFLRSSKKRNLSVASNLHLRASPRNHRTTMMAPAVASHLQASSEIMDLSQGLSPSTPSGGPGPRMMRSSSMRGMAAPAVELNNASLQHVRKLLRQLLQDADFQSISSWEKALVPILLQATDDVNPDVIGGDDIDIRHFVKIKRIPGGRPGDTSYVSGLVFSKNLALKSMPRSIAHPNILIVTFALEYARHQQHFMSLEPVIRQEREYLQNLISRISALHPQLLLVQRNVSGLALELLERANIATAYNVKPSVLEAVSRCCQTRIISSIDKLAIKPAQAGTCASFYLKTYVHHGRKKTYTFLSGCSKELGCTIVLRGADREVLADVKRITEFMVYVVYNLKLETCLMRDEFALIPSSIEIGTLAAAKNTSRKHSEMFKIISKVATRTRAEGNVKSKSEDTNDTRVGADLSNTDVLKSKRRTFPEGERSEADAMDDANLPDDVPMPTFYGDMVEQHKTKILSASPFVKFMQPYLLMTAREQERRLAYLKRLRDQAFSERRKVEEESEPLEFKLIEPDMVHASLPEASKKVREVLHAVHDAEYDKAMHNYQTQSKQWEAYIAGNINLFDPYAHQNIAVLYSVVCTITTVPCSGPDLLALAFYCEHEIDSDFEPDCTLGQYVEELCAHSNDTCLVNGCEKKMLDHHQFVETKLRFYLCLTIPGSTPSVNTLSYRFGAAIFMPVLEFVLMIFIEIIYDILDIEILRARVTWKVENDLRFRNDLFVKIEDRVNRFMLSVKNRLKSIKVDSVLSEKADACQQEVDRLTKLANDEHETLIQKLREKYMNAKYYEIIPLNRAIRYTQEKVAEWDHAFAEFDRNYFPSEKDIRRLATLQLRKIFLEREESSVPITPSDGAHVLTPEESLSEKVSLDEPTALAPQTRKMSPEKAQDMLASVVQKDVADSDPLSAQSLDCHKSPATALSPTESSTVQTSVEDLKRLEHQDIHHLDLAVSSKLSESIEETTATSGVEDKSTERLDTQASGSHPSSGSASLPVVNVPLQRRAAEDPVSKDFAFPDQNKSSGIPRPVEGHPRRSGPNLSPPLHRTQSHPSHSRNESSSTSSQHSSIFPQSSNSENHVKRLPELPTSSGTSGTVSNPTEKKLSDRNLLSAVKSIGIVSHSMIPRSIGNRRADSKVSSLAKHFEQLSREFEKERLRERRQKAAKIRRSRAYPMTASKPIVEIYRNVHEAVEEREPSDEDLMSSDPFQADHEGSSTTAAHMAHNMESQTPGEGFHAEDTAAETTENEETHQLDSYRGSDTEGEGPRAEDDHSLLEDIQVPGTAEEHHALTPTEAQLDIKLDLPKHERSSLMKMLTNFWAERSASGWHALDYPLNASDHIFADSDIIVREDEPSSLIAFALGSEDYQAKLRTISEEYGRTSEPEKPSLSREQSGESDEQIEVERSLIRSTGTHLKFQFQEGSAKMLCKVFFAEQFDAVRRKCGVSERIVESLSRCLKWDSKGGKTKSVFLKTLDDRFVLKSLSAIETQAFLRFAPAYFQIMSESLFHDLPSAIAKMLGFYQIIIKNPNTGVEFNWFLLVMENLFYDRSPTRIFDLKGSMRNRRIQSTGEQNEVLLDENMVEFIYESPLFSREHSKKLLRASVWNDTLFLSKQNVMDYSLMIAIDEERKELVVGIIDCIRTYTWDKKLEFWIKDRGKNKPTVTSPRDYKNRFREAMGRYVLQAPNCWHHFASQHDETTLPTLGSEDRANWKEHEAEV